MYVIYQPEGQEEPTRFKFDPRKLMSPEMEKLESLTGLDYGDIVEKVQARSAKCRRALLFVLLKREHPVLKYEDVTFAAGELKIEYSRQELLAWQEHFRETMTGAELAANLARIDKDLESAPDDPDQEGKAALPIVG